MDNRLRIPAIVAACLGVGALGAALSSRFHPSTSPFRADVITLVNDVGERIVVLKATVKAEAKDGKEILKTLAEGVKEDLQNASKPVQRVDVSDCLDSDSKASEADAAQTAANSWRDQMFAGSLAEIYDREAQEARAESAEKEQTCQKQLARIRKEREKLKQDATASKQLISLAGTPGAYAKYVPTYSYKLLVTDVNGKTSVLPQKITCLNSNAVYVFSRERRQRLAPHAFVAFSKPSQMTIVTNVDALPEFARVGGSVIPTQDAIHFASQEVCKYKGHVGLEIDLSKST